MVNNLYYFSPFFPWCGGRPFPFSLLLLLAETYLLGGALVCGRIKEGEEEEKASLVSSIPWSIGGGRNYSSLKKIIVAGHPLSFFLFCGGRNLSLAWSSCGGRILLGEEEEEGEKACIPWSLVGVLFFVLGETSLCWPNLAMRRRRCLVVSHLGRSLPTQRPRLEEEYGRRSRGLSKRYN